FGQHRSWRDRTAPSIGRATVRRMNGCSNESVELWIASRSPLFAQLRHLRRPVTCPTSSRPHIRKAYSLSIETFDRSSNPITATLVLQPRLHSLQQLCPLLSMLQPRLHMLQQLSTLLSTLQPR